MTKKVGNISRREYTVFNTTNDISDNGKLFNIIEDLNDKGFMFKYNGEWITKDDCKHFLSDDVSGTSIDLYHDIQGASNKQSLRRTNMKTIMSGNLTKKERDEWKRFSKKPQRTRKDVVSDARKKRKRYVYNNVPKNQRIKFDTLRENGILYDLPRGEYAYKVLDSVLKKSGLNYNYLDNTIYENVVPFNKIEEYPLDSMFYLFIKSPENKLLYRDFSEEKEELSIDEINYFFNKIKDSFDTFDNKMNEVNAHRGELGFLTESRRIKSSVRDDFARGLQNIMREEGAEFANGTLEDNMIDIYDNYVQIYYEEELKEEGGEAVAEDWFRNTYNNDEEGIFIHNSRTIKSEFEIGDEVVVTDESQDLNEVEGTVTDIVDDKAEVVFKSGEDSWVDLDKIESACGGKAKKGKKKKSIKSSLDGDTYIQFRDDLFNAIVGVTQKYNVSGRGPLADKNDFEKVVQWMEDHGFWDNTEDYEG